MKSPQDFQEYIHLISPCLGKKVEKVCRLFYVYKEEIDTDKGALEIHFSDNVFLGLSGVIGECLFLRDQPWIDSFDGDLTEENVEYIQRYGKWTLLDLSDKPFYQLFLGLALESVRLIRNEFNTPAGLEMDFGKEKIYFVTDCDEDFVLFEETMSEFRSWGYWIDEDSYLV